MDFWVFLLCYWTGILLTSYLIGRYGHSVPRRTIASVAFFWPVTWGFLAAYLIGIKPLLAAHDAGIREKQRKERVRKVEYDRIRELEKELRL